MSRWSMVSRLALVTSTLLCSGLLLVSDVFSQGNTQGCVEGCDAKQAMCWAWRTGYYHDYTFADDTHCKTAPVPGGKPALPVECNKYDYQNSWCAPDCISDARFGGVGTLDTSQGYRSATSRVTINTTCQLSGSM